VSNICTELGIRTVFVGGPFFKLVDPETKEMIGLEKEQITRLIEYYEAAGCKVHNAHRREAWGKEFLTAPEACTLDFNEIAASDIFVAFPGSPASPGTHVEIGWATATGKPTVLLLEKDKHYTFLVSGLQSIANIELVTYEGDFGFMDALEDAMRKVMTRARDLVAG
jgi:nucleoside 2-deoxyribosyltransferase